jgi:DNA-binding protein WhiA
VIEVELDTSQSARRLKKDIADIYGHDSDLAVLTSSGLRKGSRYVVRVIEAGEALARQTGLIDSHGRPIRGLPPQVVAANVCDAEAAWRGAFMAHGSLTEPGRSSSLEITCPGPEAALALVGAARRLNIAAKAREVRGIDRVVIRDGDAIGNLLTRLGAHESVLAKNVACAVKSAQQQIDSLILMMQIFVVPQGQPLQQQLVFNERWKSLAQLFLIILRKRANFASPMDRQASKNSDLSRHHR